MSKVFIEESTLSSIGDAIRNKTGKSGLIAPQDMATEINSVVGGANRNLANVMSKTSTPFTISKNELEGITTIGNYVCENVTGLVGIEFPDSLRSIGQSAFSATRLVDLVLPKNLNTLSNLVFNNITTLKTVEILNNSAVINASDIIFSGCNALESIAVPSKLYDAYLKNGFWNNQFTESKFVPVGEWVLNTDFLKTYLSYNRTREYVFNLIDFEEVPSVSVVSTNPDVVEVSQAVVNADNTELTLTIRTIETEGEANISITIIGKESTYSFNSDFVVMEVLPESTYEVVPVEGATYGFVLNENGFYESTNKKVPGSYAICQINISNLLGRRVYIDCISYGESNYDYGILSYPNEVLALKSTLDSSAYKHFKGMASANIQTVEYTTANGDCFIQVKYIKDASGDRDYDSLQFKVRFSE